jgi:hypothetical protein
VSGWWLIPVLFFGVSIGAAVERYRWMSWARREHPEEVDTTWL